MRRLAPWLLLSLVVVGAAVAAALGIAQRTSSSTPSQWVAGVLASTEKAGSAHFSYTHVTSSPNPELRGSLAGHGVVDFTTGDVRVTEVDHDISFSDGQPAPAPGSLDEHRGRHRRGRDRLPGQPDPGLHLHRRIPRASLPWLARSQRGLSLALNASVALDTLRGPYAVASVTDLGPAEVDGVATSQYEVEYAPLHVCAPHQAPQVLTQRPSRCGSTAPAASSECAARSISATSCLTT